MEEVKIDTNKTRIYIGLPKEPDINLPVMDDGDEESADIGGDGAEKPKKKKSKKDNFFQKRSRNDPNAPPPNRIPLPDLRDSEKLDKMQIMRESARRLKLSSETLPSICFYTLLNASVPNSTAVHCVEISEDSALLAAGLSDSTIKVWSLTPSKLKSMKSAYELELIDREADDVLPRMMDDKNTSDVRVLHGHSGPIYGLSFSPDRTLLLSASEDATIRLWSLQTWTNICCYKGHCFPIWDVAFSPHGYYFVSAGHDTTARLWATDSHQPLRLFVGHKSDVDCVQFHQNSNYVATGSSDKSIKLWDVLNGQCVRHFSGHEGKIHAIIFTTCGRFLISSGEDKRIMLWDLAHGYLLASLGGHSDSVYSLSISRDGVMLASGGADDSAILWDLARLIDEIELDDLAASIAPPVKTNNDKIYIKAFHTKSTNVLAIHFTRRNLVLAAGVFH